MSLIKIFIRLNQYLDIICFFDYYLNYSQAVPSHFGYQSSQTLVVLYFSRSSFWFLFAPGSSCFVFFLKNPRSDSSHKSYTLSCLQHVWKICSCMTSIDMSEKICCKYIVWGNGFQNQFCLLSIINPKGECMKSPRGPFTFRQL